MLIITIPFGVASFKMAGLTLVPLGTRVVDGDRADGPGYRVAASSHDHGLRCRDVTDVAPAPQATITGNVDVTGPRQARPPRS